MVAEIGLASYANFGGDCFATHDGLLDWISETGNTGREKKIEGARSPRRSCSALGNTNVKLLLVKL
jgi:hypothetical protein